MFEEAKVDYTYQIYQTYPHLESYWLHWEEIMTEGQAIMSDMDAKPGEIKHSEE